MNVKSAQHSFQNCLTQHTYKKCGELITSSRTVVLFILLRWNFTGTDSGQQHHLSLWKLCR